MANLGKGKPKAKWIGYFWILVMHASPSSATTAFHAKQV